MVSVELIDEVIYVSLKNEFISKELLCRIIMNVVDQCDEITKDFFNGIVYSNTVWEIALATCDDNGVLTIDYEYLIDYEKKLTNMSFLQKNLEIIKYVLHEIGHLQEKSKKQKEDYESKIIKLGDADYIYSRYYDPMIHKLKNFNVASRFADRKYRLFYEKNWNIIPSERIAEIGARKALLDSLNNYYANNLNNSYMEPSTEHTVVNNQYIKSLQLGYKKIGRDRYNVPIIDFFTELDRLSQLKKIGIDLENKRLSKIIKDLDLESKFLYGLPIKHNDVEELNKNKIMTRR